MDYSAFLQFMSDSANDRLKTTDLQKEYVSEATRQRAIQAGIAAWKESANFQSLVRQVRDATPEDLDTWLTDSAKAYACHLMAETKLGDNPNWTTIPGDWLKNAAAEFNLGNPVHAIRVELDACGFSPHEFDNPVIAIAKFVVELHVSDELLLALQSHS